jgi:ABC-type proline/glycine betaine transport system permease subunit
MCKTLEVAVNNSSMLTADRGTHLKIVVVSLVCATIVAGIGIAARVNVPNGRMEATVITVGKPVTAATNNGTSIR